MARSFINLISRSHRDRELSRVWILSAGMSVPRNAKQVPISKAGLHVFTTPEFRLLIASTRKTQMICIFATSRSGRARKALSFGRD